jgi:adenylate cyclase
MDALEAKWRSDGHGVMKVRIGLHTSSVLVGNNGSDERLSYTAIGDGVNVASRLEGMNKELGSSVCVSEAVIHALGDRAIARPLRPIRVKGRKQGLMVYELLAIAGTDDPELAPNEHDAKLVSLSTRAAAQRASGELDAAASTYREMLAEFPEDRVALLLLNELEIARAATNVALVN